MSQQIPVHAELRAPLGQVPGATTTFAHHGLAVTAADEVLGFHAGQLVGLSPDGRVRALPTGLTEGHGLTVVREADGQESVWIADPGFANACIAGPSDPGVPPDFGAGLSLVRGPGRVVRVGLHGERAGAVEAELPTPPLPDGLDGTGPFAPYAPTSVAVDEVRHGGTGDVWVADGYGSFVVHRFDATGRHLMTLTGTEGAGRFDCPHAVFVRRRPDRAPELLVADRGNARVCAYDLDGTFLRVVGEGVLTSPSGFAQWGEDLVVVELFSRLTLLDADDQLVGHVGEDPAACERPGWPNALDSSGAAVAPAPVAPGVLNSPHAAAVDSTGALVVGEWLVGGRYTTFTRA